MTVATLRQALAMPREQRARQPLRGATTGSAELLAGGEHGRSDRRHIDQLAGKADEWELIVGGSRQRWGMGGTPENECGGGGGPRVVERHDQRRLSSARTPLHVYEYRTRGGR